MASSVNLRSGLVAVGALRQEEGSSEEPVALETTVVATGARPGDTAAKRELFTEETQTVLVFERGAVIRLSAAVVDGQLLFLTNKSTGKEIVTQVLRKRCFRPTNCYVDLQFTEPCPDFWGIKFPKSSTPSGEGTRTKILAVEDDSERALASPAVPPSLQEVESLKHEVSELQTQLTSLLQPAQDKGSDAARTSEVKAASESSEDLAKKLEEKRLAELFDMEMKQEEAQLPKRLVAYPQRSSVDKTKQDGSRKWMLAAGAVILMAAAGSAAYQFGALEAKKTAARQAPPNSLPSARVVPKPVVATAVPGTANGAPTQPSAEQPTVTKSSAAKPEAPAINSKTATDNTDDGFIEDRTVNPVPAVPPKVRAGRNFQGELAPGESKRSKISRSGGFRSKTAISVSKMDGGFAPGIAPEANSDAVSRQGDYVAPELIKGSKSVAPPEAIRNYVAGNVNMDALVDTTGHVHTVTILSGPAKLYAKATEVMKQYLYEPAKRNGKPVPAHVQVSLQFWYAP